MAGCRGCITPKETLKLRLIRRRHWPETWAPDSKPGDLLLLSDQVGKGGGLLRITRPESFILLSEDQVWRRHPVTWPFSDGRVMRILIVGQTAEFILK